MITLVLGGARSGKSSFAEEIVAKLGGKDVNYIATSQAKDKEMEERIKNHQNSRPKEWTTYEEPKEVSSILANLEQESVILLDCLTLLVSNLLLDEQDLSSKDYDFNANNKEEEILAEIKKMITIAKKREQKLVIVSNEVGQGLVPAYKSGRIYRDIVGRANQLVAKQADKVYITYAGLPVEIKRLAEEQWTMNN